MRKFVLFIMTFIFVVAAGCLSFGETKEDSIIYYKNIYIFRDDTLWQIAETYKQNIFSTSEYIALIKDFNNMKNDKIIAGENLIIPIYELYE